MIDIHSHILPKMDDGAADLSVALKMAKLAVKEGVTEIVATPHSYDGVYNCQKAAILDACEKFSRELAAAGIALIVHPGAEIRLTPETVALYDSGELLTMGDKENAILLELPELFIQESVIKVIGELVERRLKVIIAHPERNLTIRKNTAITGELVKKGCMLQITAASLIGTFGRPIKKLSEEIIHSTDNVCVATDSHNVSSRPPKIKKAMKRLTGIKGDDFVAGMTERHTNLLMKQSNNNMQACG